MIIAFQNKLSTPAFALTGAFVVRRGHISVGTFQNLVKCLFFFLLIYSVNEITEWFKKSIANWYFGHEIWNYSVSEHFGASSVYAYEIWKVKIYFLTKIPGIILVEAEDNQRSFWLRLSCRGSIRRYTNYKVRILLLKHYAWGRSHLVYNEITCGCKLYVLVPCIQRVPDSIPSGSTSRS